MQEPESEHPDARRSLTALSGALSLLALVRRLRGRESAAAAFARARSEAREVLDPAERADRWRAYQRAAQRDERLATLVTVGVVSPAVGFVFLLIVPRLGILLLLASTIPWLLYGWFDADRYLMARTEDLDAQTWDPQHRGSGLLLDATLRADAGADERMPDEES
jgi:hypothetical protein